MNSTQPSTAVEPVARIAGFSSADCRCRVTAHLLASISGERESLTSIPATSRDARNPLRRCRRCLHPGGSWFHSAVLQRTAVLVPDTRSNSVTDTPRGRPARQLRAMPAAPSVDAAGACKLAGSRRALAGLVLRLCAVCQWRLAGCVPVLVGSAPADCRVRLRSAMHCETGPAGRRAAM